MSGLKVNKGSKPEATASAVPAPSKAAQAADGIHYVDDSKGRKLGIKRLDPLSQFKITCAVGAEIANNSAALNYAYMACCVASVDDDPLPRPATLGQVEARMSMLGNEGFAAIGEAIASMSAAETEESDGGAEAAKN
jgi:hypothetical protein